MTVPIHIVFSSVEISFLDGGLFTTGIMVQADGMTQSMYYRRREFGVGSCTHYMSISSIIHACNHMVSSAIR